MPSSQSGTPSSASPAQERPARLDSLTGLRALAALVVFGIHATGPRAPEVVRRLTEQGAVGVSFFYVLSGFVLTWSARPVLELASYARHRAARILPLYWLACVLALVVIAVEDRPGVGVLEAKALWGFTLLQAWSPDVTVYFGGNEVGWSLSAEVFFYLLLPVLLPRLRALEPRGLVVVLAGCVLFSEVWPVLVHTVLGGTATASWLINILPLVRAPEFVVGVCLALLTKSGRAPALPLLPVVGLTAAAYVVAGFVPAYVQRVPVTLIPFALLVLAAAQADLRQPGGWFARPLLVRLGTWSFAFYLLHQLVVRVQAVIQGSSSQGALSLLATTLVSLVVAVAVSGLAFVVVERPLERRLRGPGPASATSA